MENKELFEEQELLPTTQNPINGHGSSGKGQGNGTTESTRQQVLWEFGFLLDLSLRECGWQKQRQSQTEAEAIVTQPEQEGEGRSHLWTGWSQTPSPAGARPAPPQLSKAVENRAWREENNLCCIRFGFQHKDPTLNSTLTLQESLCCHSLPSEHPMTPAQPLGSLRGGGQITAPKLPFHGEPPPPAQHSLLPSASRKISPHGLTYLKEFCQQKKKNSLGERQNKLSSIVLGDAPDTGWAAAEQISHFIVPDTAPLSHRTPLPHHPPGKVLRNHQGHMKMGRTRCPLQF